MVSRISYIYVIIFFAFLFGLSPKTSSNSSPQKTVEKLIHSIRNLCHRRIPTLVRVNPFHSPLRESGADSAKTPDSTLRGKTPAHDKQETYRGLYNQTQPQYFHARP